MPVAACEMAPSLVEAVGHVVLRLRIDLEDVRHRSITAGALRIEPTVFPAGPPAHLVPVRRGADGFRQARSIPRFRYPLVADSALAPRDARQRPTGFEEIFVLES
jgi:hypothetical protein